MYEDHGTVHVGHHSATDYPAGQAWQQWSQVRPSAAHTGVMHQPQVVSAQAMYPAQPVYPGSMAVPQYGYMPQQAMYHQSLGAYAGNGSIYSGNGNAYAPSAREYQQSQAQLDYNCQVSFCLSHLLISPAHVAEHKASRGCCKVQPCMRCSSFCR